MSTNPVTVESINPQDAKLASLRSLFPEAFREWKLDTNLLSATLGESISNERESYSMSWAGKSDARKQIVTPTTNTLSPDEASSVDFAGTDNIIIEWDNLEVLKLLQKSYTKQVKMIYIDPPYNTGKDFVYHDNFHTSTAEYEEASGQRDSEWAKLVQNTETNGRYHSDWLSMMYPRLHLARNLLRDDGVIFVSIDDHEVHNLRKIMDEVFWEENFIGDLIRKTKSSWNNDDTGLNIQQENCLIYSKILWGITLRWTKKSFDSYENPDNDPNWEWASDNPTANDDGRKTKNLFWIKNPYTWKIDFPPPWRHWAFNEEWLKNHIETWKIFFREEYTNSQRWFTYKTYKSEVKSVYNSLNSLDLVDNLYLNQKATKAITAEFGSKIFEYSKPVDFIKKIILSTWEEWIILDFFAWSGTTGHSIMALNTEEKTEAIKNGTNPDEVGNRRYICVQLPEETSEKSEAYKAGYKKISEITAERLRRAGKKIKEENPSVSFDSGFRLYRLTPSCYQVASVEYDSENSQGTLESLERAIASGVSPLREWASEADVIAENLIKEWFLLNSRLDSVQIWDNHFLHAEREWKRLYMSFESDISMSTIQSLSREYSEAIFVVYDKALDDSRKVMLSDRVKLRTI